MAMKIVWKQSLENPLKLFGYADELHPDTPLVEFITEEDMIEIANWCYENNCGKRTSFDTFQFKNKRQVTMFLLRWA